jgi:hypothetical protein
MYRNKKKNCKKSQAKILVIKKTHLSLYDFRLSARTLVSMKYMLSYDISYFCEMFQLYLSSVCNAFFIFHIIFIVGM